jgi:DNA-binding MarR family transcriptional regulator
MKMTQTSDDSFVDDPLEQARFIFTTGKLIRNRVFRNYTGHSASQSGRGKLGGLSLPQIHAVNVTRERGQVSIKELAAILGVSPPSASTMVDRLVEKGVLRRERSLEDRRRVVVSVSPDAVQSLEELEGAILASFVGLVRKVGPEIARKWCEVLQAVKEVQDRENTR